MLELLEVDTDAARVLAVCTSRKKGMRKEPLTNITVRENHGFEGDAHASEATHRQVSLLAAESIDKMRRLGLELDHGDFAENITTQGISLTALPIGTRLTVGDEAVLEITQIGKECHTRCAIYRQAGTCIMPEEGVFARVIKGGNLRPGNFIKVLPEDIW